MYLPLFAGVLCWSSFWYALLYVLSSFAMILTRKRELVALLLLYFRCLVTVNIPWLFLTEPWVGLQFVIVVFPDDRHFFLYQKYKKATHAICSSAFKLSLFIKTYFSSA